MAGASEAPFVPLPAGVAADRRRGGPCPEADRKDDDYSTVVPYINRSGPTVPVDGQPESRKRSIEEVNQLKDAAEYSCRRRVVQDLWCSLDAIDGQRFQAEVRRSVMGSVRPASPPPQPSERNVACIVARQCQTRTIAFDFEDGCFYYGECCRFH